MRRKVIKSATVTDAPTSAELYVGLDWDARLVTIAGIVDGYLILHMFRETAAGTIDLVGLHIEAMAAPMPRIPTTAELAQYRGDTSVSAPEIEAFLAFSGKSAAPYGRVLDGTAVRRADNGMIGSSAGRGCWPSAGEVAGSRPEAALPGRAREGADVDGAASDAGQLLRRPDPPVRRAAGRGTRGEAATRRRTGRQGIDRPRLDRRRRRRGLWRTSGRGSPGGIAITRKADDGKHHEDR